MSIKKAKASLLINQYKIFQTHGTVSGNYMSTCVATISLKEKLLMWLRSCAFPSWSPPSLRGNPHRGPDGVVHVLLILSLNMYVFSNSVTVCVMPHWKGILLKGLFFHLLVWVSIMGVGCTWVGAGALPCASHCDASVVPVHEQSSAYSSWL